MEMEHDDTDVLNTMLDLEPPLSEHLSTPTVEEKNALTATLTHIRQRLIPCARSLVDNEELMMMLFDKVEIEATHAPPKTY